MKVCNSQLERLSQVHFQKFMEEMLVHATTWFPESLAASGESAIRETIALCIRRARQYGFVSSRNICLYLNAMLAWGGFFDVDPQLPWAQQILNDHRIPNPTERINALSDASESAWGQIQGPEQKQLTACLSAIAHRPDEVYAILASRDAAAFQTLLKELHPVKKRTLGASGMRELSARSRIALNAASPGRTVLEPFMTFLMFIWGAGLPKDPQFPWLEPLLRNRRLAPDELQAQIWTGALDHLNRFLSPLETTFENHG